MRQFCPKRVSSRRRRMGKTQTSLSGEIGISQASICAIEKGRKMPKACTLAKLADALKCDLEYFFGA